MQFYNAQIADILRCNQRDEAFINDLESQLHSFLKYINNRSYHRIRQSIPLLANIWYYYMTSLNNLQTLGEEYAGILRIAKNNKIPSTLMQTIWLILHIGGEPLFDRVLIAAEKQINRSISLTSNAKEVLLKLVRTFKNQKLFLRRIHHSLFYITGNYYNISNRFTGIRYILLRQWMQDNSFTSSFNLLGKISLFYILFNIVQAMLSKDFNLKDAKTASLAVESSKYCVLCTENIKGPTATPCGHIFCWDCIQDSLSYQKSCPICREEVRPNRIIFLQNYM